MKNLLFGKDDFLQYDTPYSICLIRKIQAGPAAQGITFGNTPVIDDESDDFRFGVNENVSEAVEELIQDESSTKRQ